jgi:hypothetical protein
MKPYNILYSLVSLMLSLCTCLGAQAVELKPQGVSVEDIVPAGWSHQEAQGDLNKDGIHDLVIVATPDDVENTITRSDGYVYNFNQPILAIYFGSQQGQLQLWKQYDNVIPADESEFCQHEIGLEITPRGTLRIVIGVFCSAGSYGTSTNTYTYRFQNGDFYLIGQEGEEMQRNTGERTVVSENYLTWKRQVVKSNAFDETIPSTEKWTKLRKRSLEKLGAQELVM